jgi:hypothetical protein
VKRREFITLLSGAAAAAWPLPARTQDPTKPVIGFLNAGSPAAFSELALAFRRGLNESAPKGNKNAFKHGRYTAEASANRRKTVTVLRAMRALARSTVGPGR